MKILCDIDKTLPKFVRANAENRASSKLERFTDAIEEVRLMLRDLNGPRGGQDAECLVTVHLRHMPEIIIQERSDSIGKAMYNALERASRTIARNLQKRTHQLQKGPRLLDEGLDAALA
ncbi:MAG: hypothetical protein R3C12_20515 [Planctomycetaceae bacterium]|nr:hypothetical protein [Planctomycetaceae bacterium]